MIGMIRTRCETMRRRGKSYNRTGKNEWIPEVLARKGVMVTKAEGLALTRFTT
jgi:hypothetical protein